MLTNIQLILDEQSVAESRGVTFHLNQAVKHPENPVLLPGEPHQWDSLCVCWPGTVLYSPRDRKFRCWYSGMDVVQSPDRKWRNGYAESDDGVHWTKPNLGQVEFLGRPTNQIKPGWDVHILSCVFENPSPEAPAEQRFGSYWAEYRFTEATGDYKKSLWTKGLAWSPDGITWTRAGTAYGEKNLAVFHDIYQVMYDPDDPEPAFRWKAYGQVYLPRPDGSGWPGIRHIGLAHGADVSRIEDAADRVILRPEPGIDEELHFAVVSKVGDTYLMLFESDRFSKNPIHGDLRLAVSRDGRTFRRVHPRTPIVPTGPKGTWDENLIVTADPAIRMVDDTMYIFYFGCPRTYQSWPLQYAVSAERCGARFAPVYLGLATLPRDRFAYATGAGTLTTHPLELTADGLWLNAEGDGIDVTAFGVPPSGGIRAGPTEVGTPNRGRLGIERCQSVYRKVVWGGAAPRGTCRLEIALADRDRLFSIAYP
jgi:hypothetical protein